MPIFEPDIPTQRESHEIDLWEKEECYRFYVRERRRNCTFREIMNLWTQSHNFSKHCQTHGQLMRYKKCLVSRWSSIS